MTHEITSAVPANRRPRRKGRGEASGRGKTSGRGHKGSKARVGKYIKRGYEGGQTPIFRRFPKRGFSNDAFERKYYVVNVADLNRFDESETIDAAAFISAGLVPNAKLPVKVLGQGDLQKKVTVSAGWFSRSALEKITQAGGTAQNAKGEPFAFPKVRRTEFRPASENQAVSEEQNEAAAQTSETVES